MSATPNSAADETPVNHENDEPSTATTLDEEAVEATVTLGDIMTNVVSSASRRSYANANLHFVLHFFREAATSPEHRAFFPEATFTMLQREAEATGDDGVKQKIKNLLNDFTNPFTNPFNLQAVTFPLFSQYIIARKNTMKDNGEPYSNSSFQGIRSAFMHMFRIAKEDPHVSITADITQFMAGLRRTVAQDIQGEGLNCEPGKSPMEFRTYKKICEILVRSKKAEHIFTRCWLTLEWSLISRADNCRSSHLNHIEWRGDCLIIFFAKSKTNQDGVDRSQPWHVHANPFDPSICPIHALAIYLLTNAHLLSTSDNLFPGKAQYNRYQSNLKNIIKEHEDELNEVGSAYNLGTHSIRKGAATYCCSGTTASPSIVAICLRAQWTLSGAKERYLKYEQAGDQYVSRLVSGLDPVSPNFAASPPYFHFGETEEEGRSDLHKFLTTVLEVQPGRYGLATYLLATVCHHWDWYCTEAHALNPFRSSSCYSHLTPSLLNNTLVSFPWNKKEECPTLTGIPPHVSILSLLEHVHRGQEKLEGNIVNHLVAELNERGTFGGFNENRMRALLDSTVTRLETRLEGVIPTRATEPMEEDGDDIIPQQVLHYHFWGGKIHLLPQNWVIPNGVNLKGLLNLYFMGVARDSVPPLSYIKTCSEVEHLVRGKKKMSDMRRLIGHVEVCCRAHDEGAWERNSRQWTTRKINKVHNIVWRCFNFNGDSEARFNTRSWNNIIRTMYRKKIRSALCGCDQRGDNVDEE